MRISWNKATVGTLMALTLSLSLAATPASANDGWVGPAVGLGVLGGVMAGAAIAGSQGGYHSHTYYDGGDCWIERRPVFDDDGEIIGRRRVRVCN